MTITTHKFHRSTRGFSDVHDLTGDLARLLAASDLSDGLLTVFIPGSTAGVTTIEFEPGVVEDFHQALERLAPQTIAYRHDARWGDGNGFAHVRAALIGPSLTLPFHEKKLLLGTWQQVVLVDFDNRPRDREIIVQIFGN
jgi:secondary thiamine-phosphate synthase enzyme